MRKLYVLLVTFFVSSSLFAQTPPYYKTGTGTSGNTIPLNQTSQKTQLLYTPSDFNAVPPSGFISKIFFRNSAAGTTGTYSNLKISFLQNTDPSFPGNSFYTGLTTVLSETSFSVTANAVAGGWFEIPLPPIFNYDNTKTLIVEIQYTGRSGGISTTTSTSVGTKRVSGMSLTNTTGTASTTWNDFGLEVIGTCTDPATPGQAVSNASATGVCPGTLVGLNLTGHSTGINQTYKWQSAAAQAGPYSDISPESVNASLNVNPNVTTWYRAVVKCGVSGTPQTSDPVQVLVTQPLPAGTYTINNAQSTGGTNFQSFTDAVNRMACGIAGHVTFDVSAGQVFNESPEITVSGTASSTITFRRSGTGANPKISKAGTSSSSNYLLKLTGVDYITFDGIDFEQTGTSSADFVEYGIYIINSSATNGSQRNTFKNGTVTMGYVTNDAKAIFMDDATTPSSSAGTNSFNRFINMKLQNSFAGYYFSGTTSDYPDDGNEISTESGGSSTISGLGNGTTSGTIYGIYGSYQQNLVVRNTEIFNFAGGSTSAVYASYFVTSAANAITYFNNHLHDITGGGSVYGLYLSSGTSLVAYNNHIHAIRSNTSTLSTVRGMDIGGSGLTATIYSNRIYDISSSGLTTTTVAGIETGSGSEFIVYNNMISDLRAPSSTNTVGVRGISVATSTAGSTVRLYYNSVHLSETAGNASYASAALYSSSSNPTLDLKNNLFINKSEVAGGTRAAAFWKNNSTINLDVSSDNNLYYAGVPGPKNLIYYDGTNSSQTLAAYKTVPGISPREENSVTENVTLLAVTAGVIRIDPFVQSLAESGGKEIAGYTTDFEGTQRGPYPLAGQMNGAGIKPDIGADEYDGRTTDVVGPTIDYVPLKNTSATANRMLVVTITDPSGVSTGANGPRLYYRKSGTTAYIVDDNPSISGNQFTFSFNHSLVGGVSANDVIEYYVSAQDLNGYASTSPFGGSGSNPPGTIAPSNPATYRILNTLSGTYTVGASGNYLNLTAIASLLNSGSHEVVGNVVFELQSDYDGTSGETFPVNFTAFVTNNPAWTVTVRPAAGVTGRVTAGESTSSNPLVNLNGVDRIIFDGRPGGTGNSREWTLRNTRTTSTISSVFRFINDATNDTLRYLVMEGEPTSTSQGLVVFSTSAAGTLGNSFNMVANNLISGRTDVASSMSIGIYSSGTDAVPNTDNTIQGNQIANFVNYGIYLTDNGNGNNWKLDANHIYTNHTGTVARYGIYLASPISTNTAVTNNTIGGSSPGAAGLMSVDGNVAVAGINITDGLATVTGNTIANISNTNTGTSARLRGINITSTVTGPASVSNNTIYNLSTFSGATGTTFGNQVIAGILIAPSGTLVNYTVNQNTVYNLSVENTSALTVSNIAAGLALYNLQNTTVANNRVYGIKNKTTGSTTGQPPVAAGIFSSFFSNTSTLNNMIALGAGETTNTQFIGIMQLGRGTGNVHNYYYNSVYIEGAAGGTISSYGFARGVDTTSEQHQIANLRNNIFYVTRSGSGSANYPVASRGLVPGGGWTSNYNVLYSTDPAAIGYWNATGYNLADWQTTTGNDANSKSVEVSFVNPQTADLHLTGGSVGDMRLGGLPIPGINVDFDLQARNSLRPYMGADEGGIGLPVYIEYFKGARQNNDHILTWKGHCTGNNNVFTVERSANGRDFTAIGELTASQSECGLPFILADRGPLPGTNYYRLRIRDENGKVSYSIVIAILNRATGFDVVSVFPTPAKNSLYLNLTSTHKVNLQIAIVDGHGRTIRQKAQEVQQGSGLMTMDVTSLPAGVYLLQCRTTEGFEKTIRFVKQ